MDKKDITSYLKHNGFIIPNAGIYGGFAKSWDLGPYGAELKRKLKNLWWKIFITSSPYNIGVDSAILTSKKILEASGHLKNFHDWLVECSNCQKRHRLDNLISSEELLKFFALNNKNDFNLAIKCPNCQKKNLSSPRQFNLLLNTDLQITKEKENSAYLRPETCQGIFVNFNNVQTSSHKKLPFGIGQIGKSFRNEITLQRGIFRTREFEQMELEFFCHEQESEKWWNYWIKQAWNFLNKVIINNKKKIKKVFLEKEELPHYSKKTLDLYFDYHFGWGELCSNSHRGNFDLTQHNNYSQQKLGIKEDNEFIIPNVIEVSFGVERIFLSILEDAYQEEIIKTLQSNAKKESIRSVLKIHPLLTPYFVAVIPLSKELKGLAQQIYFDLLKSLSFNVTWEESSSIGKSYRRQDSIGTYYCLTVDFQSVQEQIITCRQRDNMKQIKLNINSLKNYLTEQYEKHWQEFMNE